MKTLVTILDFLNEMLVLILEVCAVSMGIPYFAKVHPTPLHFYDRPIVVPVFAEYPKRIVVFTKKKKKKKKAESENTLQHLFCRELLESDTTKRFPWNHIQPLSIKPPIRKG